jgi:hypothetical protein
VTSSPWIQRLKSYTGFSLQRFTTTRKFKAKAELEDHSGTETKHRKEHKVALDTQSTRLLRKSLPKTKFGGSRLYVLSGAEPNQRENGDLDAKQRTARNRSTQEPARHHHSCTEIMGTTTGQVN